MHQKFTYIFSFVECWVKSVVYLGQNPVSHNGQLIALEDQLIALEDQQTQHRDQGFPLMWPPRTGIQKPRDVATP